MEIFQQDFQKDPDLYVPRLARIVHAATLIIIIKDGNRARLRYLLLLLSLMPHSKWQRCVLYVSLILTEP